MLSVPFECDRMKFSTDVDSVAFAASSILPFDIDTHIAIPAQASRCRPTKNVKLVERLCHRNGYDFKAYKDNQGTTLHGWFEFPFGTSNGFSIAMLYKFKRPNVRASYTGLRSGHSAEVTVTEFSGESDVTCDDEDNDDDDDDVVEDNTNAGDIADSDDVGDRRKVKVKTRRMFLDEVVRPALMSLKVTSKSRCHGLSNVPSRNRKNMLVFREDWPIFAARVKQLLVEKSDILNIKDVYFYRAWHGLLCEPSKFSKFVRTSGVNAHHEDIVICQVHIGLTISPPADEALIVNLSKVRDMRSGSSQRYGFTKYHPHHLARNFGQFQIYDSLPVDQRVTFWQGYAPEQHVLKERAPSGLLFVSKLYGNMRHARVENSAVCRFVKRCEGRICEWDEYLRSISHSVQLQLEYVITTETFASLKKEDIFVSPSANPLLQGLIREEGIENFIGWSAHVRNSAITDWSIVRDTPGVNIFSDGSPTTESLMKVYDAEQRLHYFVFGDTSRVDYNRLSVLLKSATLQASTVDRRLVFNLTSVNHKFRPRVPYLDSWSVDHLCPIMWDSLKKIESEGTAAVPMRDAVFDGTVDDAGDSGRSIVPMIVAFWFKIMGIYARRYHGLTGSLLDVGDCAFKRSTLTRKRKRSGYLHMSVTDNCILQTELRDMFCGSVSTFAVVLRSLTTLPMNDAMRVHILGYINTHVEAFPPVLLDTRFPRDVWYTIVSTRDAMAREASSTDSGRMRMLRGLRQFNKRTHVAVAKRLRRSSGGTFARREGSPQPGTSKDPC